MHRLAPLPRLLRSGARLLALWFLVGSIAAVASERVFWFWSPSVLPHIELAAFYGLPAAVALLVIGRFRVDLGWSLLLVAPIFAFAVEGVLTPIIYTGPFLPIFPAWFAWWHGIAALIGFVVVLRSWLLAERTGWLAAASVAIGAFWGLWSSTLWLPENVEDPELVADLGELVVLGPASFARYAVTFTAVLIVSHLLLGFVWPSLAEPHPIAEWVVGGLVAIAVVAWTVALPWALPMLALYLWWPWQALRRHRGQMATGPQGAGLDAVDVIDPVDTTEEVRHQDLFAQLTGRVRPVATLPLLLIVPAAVATYTGLWWLGPSDPALRIVMYTTIVGQAVAGGVLCIVAVRRVRQRGAGVVVGVRSRWSPPTRWFAGSR